jgi:hypothetical protein
MSSPESYINAATNNEMANRSGFKSGIIPGTTTDTAINALLLGTGCSGQGVERGEQVTSKVIKGGLRNRQRKPLFEGTTPPSSRPVATIDQCAAATSTNESEPVDARPVSHAPPARSVPDEKGEPKFYQPAEEGPSVRSEEIQLSDGLGSADTSMSRDHNAFTEDSETDQPMAPAFPEPLEMVAAAGVDAGILESDDERLYGRHAAQILRECRRDVALAPADVKTIAFQDVAKKLGQTVADQWLPKAVAVERYE